MRIGAELLRASPRREGGKACVKSLKVVRVGPRVIGACVDVGVGREEASLLSRIDNTAWVPHAFCMDWWAKKREEEASGAKVPSWALVGSGRVGWLVGYLKRKITP